MAVLTKDRKTERKQGVIFALPVAATSHIYAGSMVSANSAGYIVPASDTQGERFIGISKREIDNSTGVDGDKVCEGYMVGLFEMNSLGLNQTDLAKDVFVADDNSVSSGIVAQPLNVTGVTLARIALSTGGTKALAYVNATNTLSYGGGTTVDVTAGGTFVLTASDGSNIEASVTTASLPVADASDNIQLRHVKAGKAIEVISATSLFIDISTAARS